MHSQIKSLEGGQNSSSKDESHCCGRISLLLWSYRLVTGFARNGISTAIRTRL